MKNIKLFNKVSTKFMLVMPAVFIVVTAVVVIYESYFVKIKTFNDYKNTADIVLAELKMLL
jgi:hypothetical protein